MFKLKTLKLNKTRIWWNVRWFKPCFLQSNMLYVKDESKNVYKLFGNVEDFLSIKHLKLRFFVKLHFQYDIWHHWSQNWSTKYVSLLQISIWSKNIGILFCLVCSRFFDSPLMILKRLPRLLCIIKSLTYNLSNLHSTVWPTCFSKNSFYDGKKAYPTQIYCNHCKEKIGYGIFLLCVWVSYFLSKLCPL